MILSDRYDTGCQPQRIHSQQPSAQMFPDPDDQFQGFIRLNASDDPCQRTDRSALRTRRDKARLRRFGIQTSQARSTVMVEYAHPSFKLVYGCEHQRDIRKRTRCIDQISCFVVVGTVYDKIEAFGSYIAVDDIYSALIPKHRLFTEILPGMQVTANVVNVHEDGRLELSVTGKAYNEIDGDAEKILEALNEAGGFLPYHDKTSPDIIIAKFGISKNAFKRAIGHLQKNGKIFIYDNGIEKVGR